MYRDKRRSGVAAWLLIVFHVSGGETEDHLLMVRFRQHLHVMKLQVALSPNVCELEV